MTGTREYPDYVQHDDPTVSALLRLALLASDRDADADFYDVPGIAATLVRNVHEAQAREAFDTIQALISDATEFDTRGADAVSDYLDSGAHVWRHRGQTADEKATEMRDERLRDARLAAEMLVTLDARLARPAI